MNGVGGIGIFLGFSKQGSWDSMLIHIRRSVGQIWDQTVWFWAKCLISYLPLDKYAESVLKNHSKGSSPTYLENMDFTPTSLVAPHPQVKCNCLILSLRWGTNTLSLISSRGSTETNGWTSDRLCEDPMFAIFAMLYGYRLHFCETFLS